MSAHNVDPIKIATMLHRRAERLTEVNAFLLSMMGSHPRATEMYARLIGVQSFMRVDAEEIETGLCCCKDVPAEATDDLPCGRCGDTGVSEFVRALPPQAPGEQER